MIMTDWSTDLEITRTAFAFAMLGNYNIAFIGFSLTFNKLFWRQFLKYASLESTAKLETPVREQNRTLVRRIQRNKMK